MLTAVPSSTVVPLSGTLANTVPCAGPNTEPSTRPCCARAAWAAATESPERFGTWTVGGPVDTITVTVDPGGTWEPTGGVVPATRPAATWLDGPEDSVAVNPTWASAATACW